MKELLKQVESSIWIGSPQKDVLTVTDNKRQLIRIMCEELVQNQKFQQMHTSDQKILLTSEKDTSVEHSYLKSQHKVDTWGSW